jgi:coenzyme F420-reducing hydrogenase delta subunit/ferredoxin
MATHTECINNGAKAGDNNVTASKAQTLIVGNGPCAHEIAKNLLSRGVDIVLAAQGDDVPEIFAVGNDGAGGLEVLTGTSVLSCDGAVGHYEVQFTNGDTEFIRPVADVIVAADYLREPNFSAYGLTPAPGVMGLSELNQSLTDAVGPQSRLTGVQKVVFLHSLADESHPAMAREVMTAARRLQTELACRTYILTGNLKVAGEGLEALYRRTKEAGVNYIKFTRTQPAIEQAGDTVQITFTDEVTGSDFRLTPDLVVVDETISPSELARSLVDRMRLETDPAGFAQSDNVHRSTVHTNRKGIQVAGPGRGIQWVDDQMRDAGNAALAALNLLQGDIESLPDRAEINKGACVRCLTCLRVCPYGAVALSPRPEVLPTMCERCGICAAECPCHAITIPGLAKADIAGLAMAKDFPGTGDDFVPAITAFCCSRSAARAGELAHCLGGTLPTGMKIVEVPCAGSVSLDHLFAAFENGADGVLVLSCHADNCHSERGNTFARNRVEYLQELCGQIGMDRQRLAVSTLASNMGVEFREVLQGFEETLVGLGASKVKNKS